MGFVQCMSGYMAYALGQDVERRAFLVAGIDEVCNLTALKAHCTDPYATGTFKRKVRLDYDGEMVEWIVNMLRLRDFVNNNSFNTSCIPELDSALSIGEKWFRNMYILNQGNVIPQTSYGDLIGELRIEPIWIQGNIGTFLDEEFYRTYYRYGFKGVASESPLSTINQEISLLTSRSFQTSAFYSKRERESSFNQR